MLDMKIPLEFYRDNVKRYRQLIRGERVDWAPFRLWLDDTFVRAYTGVDTSRYISNFEVMFEAQRQVDERFYGLRDYCVEVDNLDIYFDREKFRTSYPDLPGNRFLGHSLDDFERFYCRKKITDVAGVKRLFEGIDFFNKRLPRNKYAHYYLGTWGALDGFSIFRGTENFLTDLYDNPSAVHRIFGYMTERSLEWLEFARKTWGDVNSEDILFDKLDIGEDYCAYLPPDLFDEFVKPPRTRIKCCAACIRMAILFRPESQSLASWVSMN
jgi:hypothetical protein